MGYLVPLSFVGKVLFIIVSNTFSSTITGRSIIWR